MPEFRKHITNISLEGPEDESLSNRTDNSKVVSIPNLKPISICDREKLSALNQYRS